MTRTLLPEQQLSTQVQGKLNDHDTYLNETIAISPSDYMYSEQLSSFLVSFPESNQLDVTHLTLKLFDGEFYTDSRRVLKNTIDGETFIDLPINSLIPDLPYEIFRNDEQNIYYKYLSMGADEMSLDHSMAFDLGRAMLTTTLSNGTSDTVELTQGLSETVYYGGLLSNFTTSNNLYGFAVQPTGSNNTYSNTDITQIMDGIVRTGRDLQCLIAINDVGVSGTGYTIYTRDANNVASPKRFVHSVNGILPDQHGNIIVSTVANSDKLDNLDSSQFLRSDTSTVANARLQAKDGIDIISGRLKIMAAAIPQIDYDYILQYDGLTGEVSKMPRGAVTVNRANSSGWADSAGHANNAGNADKIDGINGASLARTDVEEWFDYRVNFKQGLTVNDGHAANFASGAMITSGGYGHFVTPTDTTSNYYVKKLNSSSGEKLEIDSTLRMGDIVMKLTPNVDAPNPKQYTTKLVDIVPTKKTEEGDEAIYLIDLLENAFARIEELDILEQMHKEINELKEEINTLKGAK